MGALGELRPLGQLGTRGLGSFLDHGRSASLYTQHTERTFVSTPSSNLQSLQKSKVKTFKGFVYIKEERTDERENQRKMML